MNRNYLRAIPREWRNLSRVFGKEVWFWLDKAFLVDALEAVTRFLRTRA